MNHVILLSFLALGAYLLQFILGLSQIKHFNRVYKQLREKGKVAIGTRPGKISSGTIVMFAIDESAKIIDAQKMQGISVIAKFKPLTQYIGQDLHFIDSKHPLVRKENKLTQIAMEDARDLFIKLEIGDYQESQTRTPLSDLAFNTKIKTNQLLNKIKGSV